MADPKTSTAQIQVFARVRPPLPGEAPGDIPFRCTKKCVQVVKPKAEQFDFDEILPESTSQAQVYAKVGKSLVDGTFNGFDSGLIAYGQSGAGKTYSLLGSPGNPGVISHVVDELFETKKVLEAQGVLVQVVVQYVEIYVDKMYDLLTKSIRAQHRDKNFPASLGTRPLSSASTQTVSDPSDFRKKLSEGEERRQRGETSQNATSSRSHAILVCRLSQRFPGESRAASLYLVDLAGSEDVSKAAADSRQKTEAASINSSLYHLRGAVEELAMRPPGTDVKQTLTRLRRSKLTDVLRDLLAGNSRTSILLALTPNDVDADESVRTLRFGALAHRVQTVCSAHCEKEAEVDAMETEIEKTEDKIQKLEVAAKTGDAEQQAELAEAQRHHDALQARIEEQRQESLLQLQIQRQFMASYMGMVGTMASVADTLQYGIASAIQERWPVIEEHIEDCVRRCEKLVDKGIRGSDTLILRTHHKVEQWLSEWLHYGLYVPPPGDPDATDLGALELVPPTKWSSEHLEKLLDTTLDMQAELWDLENEKDELRTHYVSLAAGVNSVERELAAAREEFHQGDSTMNDKHRKMTAYLDVGVLVIQQARQRLAEKNAAMEDKCDEVAENLNRCTSLGLASLVAKMHAAAPHVWSRSDTVDTFEPRFGVVKSWQDVLPLAEDLLKLMLSGLSDPSLHTPASGSGRQPGGGETAEPTAGRGGEAATSSGEPALGSDPVGQHLGEGFLRLGEACGAWVSSFKGTKRVNIRGLVPDGDKVEADKEKGIALVSKQVKLLRQQSADISGALKTKQLTELITDLDKEAVVSGAPGKKVAVIKRVVVSENVTKTALLSWVKRQVDMREWTSALGLKPLSKTKPPQFQPSDRGISLSSEEWDQLATHLPQYCTLVG
ncbi:hypothetical protein CYMTET_23098 [Cymbomonas tetramitiformis]|uniref:Kinesin-like protein n=1 Tax=Cymbomonas tetramitiformis TaxID=36881 RepID=A0AAE0G036_9CHLO|nr:hypothetical protein CYMTET_23098 [Cymbomonas tetramitiformis]